MEGEKHYDDEMVQDAEELIMCKCCGIFKEATLDFWYKKGGKQKGLYTVCCKECKKKKSIEYNKSSKSIQYRKEYYKRDYVKNKSNYRKKDKGYDKIHKKTRRRLERLGIKVNKCSICGKPGRTLCHHPDYTKWYEVVFVCYSCHGKIHNGELYASNIINILNC